MQKVQIDTDVFCRHLQALYQHWERGRGGEAWGPNADAILVVHGTVKDSQDDDPYDLEARNTNTVALLYWLIGYEFTDIALLFTKQKLLCFVSQTKGLLRTDAFAPFLFLALVRFCVCHELNQRQQTC